MVLDPVSKKYTTLAAKIKKWAAGKADGDYEVFYLPARKRLENFVDNGHLEGSNEIMKFITLHSDIGICSWWSFHKFLDLYLNKGKDENKWALLSEAMHLRILENALGYIKPQHTAPVNDGRIGMAISDAILLNDPLGGNIISGYAQQEDRRPMLNPQSVIQYAFVLYFDTQKKDFDHSKLFKKVLVKEYADLHGKITADAKKFDDALHIACEFHLERSKSSMNYEFSREEDMIVPSELLATIQIRKSLGIHDTDIRHPLVKPYSEFIELDKNQYISDLYKSLRAKTEKEYFKPVSSGAS